MFRDRESLEDIYPSPVERAFRGLNRADIFAFTGRKLCPQFRGEAVSDYKKRPVGRGAKFRRNGNGVKTYDKRSVLRAETAVNNPRDFKIFGTARHKDGSESKAWKPMGKSVSNLYRYAEISKSRNVRFLNAPTDIAPTKSVVREIEEVCVGKTVSGRRATGFHVRSPDFAHVTEIIGAGKHSAKGFQNADIGALLFPDMKDGKKRSAGTARLIKKLRRHGLIQKVPRAGRYFVSRKGRRITGALVELRNKDYPRLVAKASRLPRSGSSISVPLRPIF